MTDEEHSLYHLLVSFSGCGVEGCDVTSGIVIHLQALAREEINERPIP
jgi:hypothetical protein